MLTNYVSPFDATVVSRLKGAGTVCLGKLNCDEFGMGSGNENSHFGPVKNPWDTSKVPGGSSGGSAAAVAAGLATVSTATDTGGSVRQPAAMGHDEKDSTSANRAEENFSRDLDRPLKGLRVGMPAEFFGAGVAQDVSNAVHKAIEQLTDLGASTVPVNLPDTELAIPAYYVIAPAEASSNLSRFDGVRYGHRAEQYEDLADMYTKTRAEGFGPEVKRRILIGAFVLSHGYYDAYYRQAQRLRRKIADAFTTCFEQVDVIAGPVSPTTAWGIGEQTNDPVKNYLTDIFTLPASLAGLPGISVPAGFGQSGLPVGLQLIGNYFDEARLLNVAHQYQQATDWHQQRPK